MLSKVVDDRIEGYFGNSDNEEFEKFWLLSLLIFDLENNNDDSDLYVMAELLNSNPTSKQYLTALIDHFDGDILRMPTKEKFRYCTMLGICWFLKDIKEWEWTQIKRYMDIPEWMMNDIEKEVYTTISFGRRIGKLKQKLRKPFLDALQNTDLDLLQNFIREER